MLKHLLCVELLNTCGPSGPNDEATEEREHRSERGTCGPSGPNDEATEEREHRSERGNRAIRTSVYGYSTLTESSTL